MLGVLNLTAAYVSWGYPHTTLAFPHFFGMLHLVAGLGIIASMRISSLLPYVFALTTGVFVGRALNIWMSISDTEASVLPTPTAILAGLQWVVLAWLVRPTVILEFDIRRISKELNGEV
jgi:hypothetical protein